MGPAAVVVREALVHEMDTAAAATAAGREPMLKDKVV